MMNGTVTFHDTVRVKPGFLKLAVHITREYERAEGGAARPFSENSKPSMGGGLAI